MKKKSKKNFAKLNCVKFGLASGILTAVIIFLLTLTAAYFNYGQHFVMSIADIYGFLGYKMNFGGAILGAVYSFIDGFIFGWLFALIYNKL